MNSAEIWFKTQGYEKPDLKPETEVYFRLSDNHDFIHGPTSIKYLDWSLSKTAAARITHYKICDSEKKLAEKTYDLANDKPKTLGAF